jgi:hypothetical protein
MAIATSTALAIGGIAVSAGSAGMSFAQANNQKKLQREAESDARQAMEEARKKLEVNYYDQLAVPKEAYELEREALLSGGAQALQAGAEQARGAGAVAGRVQMAQNEAQAGQRTSMSKELADLQKLSAEEDSRLRDVGVQLDLAEVEGAQQAASDAQQARTAAMQQGMSSATSALQQGIALAPLYTQDLGAQKTALNAAFADKRLGDMAQSNTPQGQLFGLTDFEKMSNRDFRQFKSSLTPEQRQQIFSSGAYTDNYNYFNPYQ